MNTITATPAASPFAQAAVPKKAGRSKGPPIATCPALEPIARELGQIKQAMTDLEAAKKSRMADAAALLEPMRCEMSRAQGEALTSIKVNGLTWVAYHNSQSSFDAQACDGLRGIFGERFGRYFAEAYEVVVDWSTVPHELQACLIAAGAQVNIVTKAAKALFADATLRPDVETLARQAGIQPVCSLRGV